MKGVGFGRRPFPMVFPLWCFERSGRSANASSFNRFEFVSPSAAKLMICSARAFLVASWSKLIPLASPLASMTSQASLKAISSIASGSGSKFVAIITEGHWCGLSARRELHMPHYYHAQRKATKKPGQMEPRQVSLSAGADCGYPDWRRARRLSDSIRIGTGVP
jgi:hypothetical protein